MDSREVGQKNNVQLTFKLGEKPLYLHCIGISNVFALFVICGLLQFVSMRELMNLFIKRLERCSVLCKSIFPYAGQI